LVGISFWWGAPPALIGGFWWKIGILATSVGADIAFRLTLGLPSAKERCSQATRLSRAGRWLQAEELLT
jgi:hypothetical protein